MTTSLNKILNLKSLDFESYEIRGVKSGINNARTTGPVYSRGQYVPAKSQITARGSFLPDSSVITNLSFDPPYSFLDASSLKVHDNLTIDSSVFEITNIINSNKIVIDRNSGLNGTCPILFNLKQREYLIEPDSAANTLYGRAKFTSGDTIVTGIGTSWTTDFTSNDFIKSANYQTYYKIKEVINNTTLKLFLPFAGPTVTGDYTGKKWYIGRTHIKYVKNDFTYDNQSAKWKYTSVTNSNLPTSTNFMPLADGIELKFTHTVSSTAPDLMDTATVENKVLARQTQYETGQFSLPVVPHPDTMSLYINGLHKVQGQDYVINYSQNPVYTPPPPPDQRYVANIMFLKEIKDIQPDTSLTESGQIQITDSTGNSITGIMPGSVSLMLGDTSQINYRDFMLEPNAGILEVIDSTAGEPAVKYVGSNYSEVIDYGFSVYLNGIKQKISFPSDPSDDAFFQPDFGRLKLVNQEHPGPGDVYEIHYMVSASDTKTEVIQGVIGQTVLRTSLYPIKQNSILISRGGTYLSENVDYIVSYLTGIITLSSALTDNYTFTVTYTPLSKQVNDLTFIDGTSYCTVHNCRLTVTNADNFNFAAPNKLLNMADASILRIYNETRNSSYDLANISTSGDKISLQKNNTNITVGLGIDDIVVMDYKFISNTVEYIPVEINYLNIPEGSKSVYLEGVDLTPYICSGALITINPAGSTAQYIFGIDSFGFDGAGTRITFSSTVLQDIVNPKLFITDSSVSFLTVPSMADPIVQGNSNITFHGNVKNILRSNTVLKIDNEYYRILTSSYNLTNNTTQVSLTSEIVKDYTSVNQLSSIKFSDGPVYNEGETIITPARPIVTLMSQPALVLNNTDNNVLKFNSDTTGLNINGISFLYGNKTIGDLKNEIDSSNISALTVTTYVPDWKSNKIIPSSGSIFSGSDAILYASTALRKLVDGTYIDATNFEISDDGNIILQEPLKKYDRYKLDYMGRRFLDSTQVKYSLKYFTNLPANSNIVASFEYDNLDQFYIQVLNQKDFLETVTIPRMQEEALQLNGNVGQGGDIPGDTNQGNSEGGIAGDEYRRQDAEIECKIFKNIYDFFQNRLTNYGKEMEAIVGLRLFNNDGTFSESQQNGAYKAVNRIFPRMDYTGLEPMKCNPITGYFFDRGAIFTQGQVDVTGIGTNWLTQLAVDDVRKSFIGRIDSTKKYSISSVVDNTHLILSEAFAERSTTNKLAGDLYVGSTSYPVYDDDGYLGPKHVGTKNSDFNLVDGDIFTCTLDNSDSTYVFSDPPFPISLFTTKVSNLSASDIAARLTSGIPGLLATVENVIDPLENHGYRSTIVLRTANSINYLKLGDSTVTEKLGFIRKAESWGNLDRTSRLPEIIYDSTELYYLNSELGILNNMWSRTNKLDRLIDHTGASLCIQKEISAITGEILRLSTEINSLAQIMQEPSITLSYNDASVAYLKAITALNKAYDASAVDKTALIWDWKWPIDFTERVTYLSGSGIEGATTITITAPIGNDLRILNAIVMGINRSPVLKFSDGSFVGGTWSGWDPSVGNAYSLNNQIQFTIATTPVLELTRDASTISDASYVAGATELSLYWKKYSTSKSYVLPYDNLTISQIKTSINTYTDLTATGPSVYDSYIARFKLDAGDINPNATIYYGLRDCTAYYQTISDLLLTNRSDFVIDRAGYLNTRFNYLLKREKEIIKDLEYEQILRTDTGEGGDLYIWANNRFNRRQGCYAKLKQIEQQIVSNQTALNINRNFL